MTFSLFHRKFENGPFWAQFGPFLLKMAKNRGFFAFFFENRALEFPNLFEWSLVSGVEKNDGLAFLSKIQKWPILAQIYPKFGHFGRQKIFIFTKSEKNYFRQKKTSVFRHFLSSKMLKKIIFLFIFGSTPTGRIRTYKLSLVSVCLSPSARFSSNREL